MPDTLNRILVVAFFSAVFLYAGFLLVDFAQRSVDKAIEEGRIFLNMNEQQVARAWGQPDEVTTTSILVPEEPKPDVRVITVWTFSNPPRTVTFERGRVIEFSATQLLEAQTSPRP